MRLSHYCDGIKGNVVYHIVSPSASSFIFSFKITQMDVADVDFFYIL